MITLSVAIPSYNVESFLPRCLDSFCIPALSGLLEVLVVDDGSPDRGAQIAQQYAEKHPDIFRLIRQSNGGHGAVINTALANARGKYFRVVDGDDWVNSEALIQLITVLVRSDCDLFIDQKTLVHPRSGARVAQAPPPGVRHKQIMPFDHCNSVELCDYFMIHNITVRRSMLVRHNLKLLEKVYYEDYEFALKASAWAQTVCFLPLHLYCYQLGEDEQSVSPKNYVRNYEHHLKVVQECLRFSREFPPSHPRSAYVRHKTKLLLNTHYNIALIYNKNRLEGRAQAREFTRFLQTDYPDFAQAVRLRHLKTSALHWAGVDYSRLQRLLGRPEPNFQ